MPEIVIRYLYGGTLNAWMIAKRTRSWCSHTEAVMPNMDGKFTFGAMLDGVKMRSIWDPCYRNATRIEEWHVPCTQAQHDYFWKFLHAQEGKPYDKTAIGGFILFDTDRAWREDDSWFCSELMVAAEENAKLVSFAGEVHVDRIDPGESYLLTTSLPGAYVLLPLIGKA